MHARCIDEFNKNYMHLLCMHNASTTKKSVSVRVPPKSWEDLGEMAESDRRSKKQQFEVLVDEEKTRRTSFKGGSKKK